LKIGAPGCGRRGKALITGLVPALCGYEDMGLARRTHAVPLVNAPENIKLAL